MASSATSTATISGHYAETAARYADSPALRTRDGVCWTWEDYSTAVRAAAAGLHLLGLRRGDTMASWLTNRPEFHVADGAAMHLGAAAFSVYQTFTVEQAEHVIGDAGARIVITERAFLDRVEEVKRRGRTALQHVVCVDGDDPRTIGWDELTDQGSPTFDFERAAQAVQPDDLATLIYTSGTTGPPKGVQLTHANVIAQVSALRERLRFPEGVRAISFLPMAHIAERLCTHYFPMFLGWDVTCCPVPAQVAEYLPAVRPGYFFSPPRLWDKLRAAALAGADPGTRAEIAESMQRVQAGERAEPTAGLLALRERIGFAELEVAIVGAAPCPPELIAFWQACGVALGELYGMSETTGVATVAAPDAIRIGTVGPPLPACEVRLSDAGEICMRGPVVMRGYRNLPERNAETIDADGWLHSGDIGELDDDGYLRVVDRIKELIISSAGKNMSPANIEAAVKGASSLVGEVCAIGDGRPYNVALVTLNPDAVRALTGRESLPSTQPSDHPGVLDALRTELASANQRLARVEQIKRFAVLPGEWLPDGDEMTPTMKLKRKPISEKYASTIEGLYAGTCGVDL